MSLYLCTLVRASTHAHSIHHSLKHMPTASANCAWLFNNSSCVELPMVMATLSAMVMTVMVTVSVMATVYYSYI